MKRTRGLWVSIVLIGLIVCLAIGAFATNRLAPVLGLDLQGGVSVILSAPEGTSGDTMNLALENIRNRVDAFGVGEPDIALSGSTIEVQIPGLSDSTIQERAADLFCITDPDGATYGCAEDVATPEEALGGFGTESRVDEVCLMTGEVELQCYDSKTAADAAKVGITVEPKVAASASPTASPTASPGALASPPAASEYCLTDFSGAELHCYPTRAEAKAADEQIESEVTQTSWCIVAPEEEADASPTPTASASASASPGSSSSPRSGPATAYADLDLGGSAELPCDFGTKDEADAALAEVTTEHITTRYCVVSAQDQDLGCYTSRDAATERQRETGQQRLLELIGKTARLEERPTLEIVAPNDPRFQTIRLTCQTEQERASEECLSGAQDGNEVWYPDLSGNAVHLGPVTIAGGNITKAQAALIGDQRSLADWAVRFELDGEGKDDFARDTRLAVNLPSPMNQIAIAVDGVIISNPVVNEPITGGEGVITGSFTEQEAKDLASILNAGSLPVDLTQESVRTVSPTLGSESLRQGIAAGVAGLFLLFLYLLFYYRLLGVVAWFGMAIWAVLAIALISLAGESFGYALTLAGVAGLVISLGVTADSYIVFFERLKDEVRGGRPPRQAVQPAFERAFKTIVAADIVTGIAAAVLYMTAVSSVRGFALTLGVATALDLFVVYFFKRPTVYLIARSKRLTGIRGFGLTSATGADHMVRDTETSA